jgi:ABC-2 type transport system ATP-binding protein
LAVSNTDRAERNESVDMTTTTRPPGRSRGVLAIEASGLTRAFDGVVAVDGLDLSVYRGELFALLGPNGAGKTTAIRMLSCLLRPTAGTARIEGHDIGTEALAVKRILSLSPQETAIAGHLDAWENLSLMARLHGMDKSTTRQRSKDLLEMFALAARADEQVRKFSGGMKRRLSIAMALVSDPEVLFLDEPTLGLDPRSRRGLWEHIDRLKGRITVVLTTHYLEEADALADRLAVIDDGRIVAEGTSTELKALVPSGPTMIIEADLTAAALDALGAEFEVVRPTESGAEVDDPDVSLDTVVDVLRPLGIAVDSTYRRQITLDDVFVHLTGRELRE